MKYDSYNDFIYFIMGASIASGRMFWVGEEGSTNKKIRSNSELISSVSKDGTVARLSVRAGVKK